MIAGDLNPSEKPKNLVLICLLCISLSLLIMAVSASDSTAALDNVRYTSYSKDNSYAVESTSDTIYFFDTGKNAVIWSYNISRYIGSIAISPDGTYVAAGCGGGLIYVFDHLGNVVLKQSFGDALIRSISFPGTGNYIDASNTLNQAFHIDIKGNMTVQPASQAGAAKPSATISPVSTNPTYALVAKPVASASPTEAHAIMPTPIITVPHPGRRQRRAASREYSSGSRR